MPFDLSPYVPAGLLPTLTGAEVGYLYRLLQSAWTALPPCRLPGPLEGLAMFAGAGPTEWAASGPRVMRAFKSEPDGGFTAEVALERYERLESIRRSRAEAGRRGADSKHGGKCLANGVANAVAIASVLPPPRSRSALSLSSGSALALERSDSEKTNTSARTLIQLVPSSAGARAPEAPDQDRLARIRFKLATAAFPWASPTERRLPTVKVYELGGLAWTTEVLVDFVLSRVADERPAKPLGFIFAGFGWDRARGCWGAPWVVPLVYQQLWESRQEQLRQKRAELSAAQERLNSSRVTAARAAGVTA